MSLLLLVLLAAILIGRLGGGRLGALAHLPLPRLWLIWAAFALQFVVALLPAGLRPQWRPWLVALAFGLVAAWIVGLWPSLAKVLRAAMLLIALGWAMNLTVITLNNGMPVSTAAMERVGLPPEDVTSGDLGKHVAMDDRTRLAWLGDVIPLPLIGVLRKVLSIGDVVMLLGLLVFVPAAMRLPAHGPDAHSPALRER